MSGHTYIFQKKKQHQSGGGGVAQTATLSCAQTIGSCFKSSHRYGENNACWVSNL